MSVDLILRRIAKEGDVSKMKKFLRSQENKHELLNSSQDERGWSTLIIASFSGNGKMVDFLIEEKCEVGTSSNNGWTALIAASAAGHTDIVQRLLQENIDIDVADVANGDTALMHAVLSGHTEIVEILLKHESNPCIKNKEGSTPLICTSIYGNIEIFQMLLECGPPNLIHLTDEDNDTVLIKASQNGHKDITSFILKNIHIHNININHRNNHGWTALILACWNNHIHVAQLLLLQVKVDVNIQDYNGRTALIKAIQNNNKDIVQLLLQREVSLDIRDQDGYSALAWSIQQKDYHMTNLLLQAGAYVDILDKGRWSPLIRAAFTGQSNIVRLLLSYGASINYQDSDGFSALHVACKYDKMTAAIELISLGAKVEDMLTSKGKTPLDMIQSKKSLKIIKKEIIFQSRRFALYLSIIAKTNANTTIFWKLRSFDMDSWRNMMSYI
eukprot:gene8882-18393_t